MAKSLDATRVAFPSALIMVVIAGCSSTKETYQPVLRVAVSSATADAKIIPTYITANEVKAMPPRTATYTKRLSDYSGSFTDTNGKEFILGDIRGEQWVWHFVCTLREGTEYKFPDTFLNYEAAQHYLTAKEIAAMPPCTATLATRTPCSSYFVTADGKYFGIGDPGSGVQISQFIWSLKDNETCKLPEAFLEYQKQHPDAE